jgi:hypothetical protein
MIGFITNMIGVIEDYTNMTKELKERARKEYQAALLMPRKQKKKAKKSAQILYSIACWGEDILNK